MTTEEKNCLPDHRLPGCKQTGESGPPIWGGEAAHGIEARHDQAFNKGELEPTTSFAAIGMKCQLRQRAYQGMRTLRGRKRPEPYLPAMVREGFADGPLTVDMEQDPRWERRT